MTLERVFDIQYPCTSSGSRNIQEHITTSACMSPNPLPTSSSSRSSGPILTSSGFDGVLHPVSFHSSAFNNAVDGVVHPVVVSGWSSGAVVTKASIILNRVLGGIGGAAAGRVTLCQVLVNLSMSA